MALWSGRFEEATNEYALKWGASLETDKVMAEHDIAGSIAHARMLSEQGIISEQDFDDIEAGLGRIRTQIREGTFAWDERDEDVHMAIERALTADIGTAGARLHTGRSRNDQVATDIRLLAKELADDLLSENNSLREVLLDAAEKYVDVVMPGYTHLQHAQPVLLSHHLLAYFWMLTRDHDRLGFAFDAADANPLGSAALAGTSYPLDRDRTTELLDFATTMPNSLDAVSDRDYLLDLVYACAVSMMHLSRLAEEIVLWSSSEFGFITLSDSWSTGSSIMPQKKNPDFAELTRGKMGRVVGHLMGLLVTMKVNRKRMAAAAGEGFTAATDIADYLAKKGMPFREAHAVVGGLVLECEKRGCGLEDLTLDDLRAASDLFEDDIIGTLDPESIANARTTYGGTGIDAVLLQFEEAREVLEDDYL